MNKKEVQQWCDDVAFDLDGKNLEKLDEFQTIIENLMCDETESKEYKRLKEIFDNQKKANVYLRYTVTRYEDSMLELAYRIYNPKAANQQDASTKAKTTLIDIAIGVQKEFEKFAVDEEDRITPLGLENPQFVTPPKCFLDINEYRRILEEDFREALKRDLC